MEPSATASNKEMTHDPYVQILPLQLDWEIGPCLPTAKSTYIQSVEINDTIYLGGGTAVLTKDEYIVMAYHTKSHLWHVLPSYMTRGFAMTTIDYKLVLVGGQLGDDSYSGELGVFQPDTNKWTHPFPPTSRPCSNPSVTSHKHWLVVAGGSRFGYSSRSVEILDIDNKQWSTRLALPVPWDSMKSTKIGDTWYLMGGWCGSGEEMLDAYAVSLEDLITGGGSEVWTKLPPVNFAFSSPLAIERSLLAVGGKDLQNKKPVSIIKRYVPEKNVWAQSGELPQAIYNCTCISVSNMIHVFGGWNEKSNHGIHYSSPL